MTAAELRKLYKATPFRPFRVHMADARSFEVPHPEFMLLSKSGRVLIVEDVDDAFEILDVPLVTSVEMLPKNGGRSHRPRRKR